MLDITARDGAGRLATWTHRDTEHKLPLVAHVHTENHPAPPYASAVLGDTAPEGAIALDVARSRFSEGGTALVYPGAAGSELQQAADALNAEGGVTALVHRAEAVRPASGLVALPLVRSVAEDPWRLADLLVDARTRAGPNAVLFAPGLGSPHQIALAVYAGIDVLDGLVPVIAALQGKFLTPEGALDANTLSELPCACTACNDALGTLDRGDLEAHNRWAAEQEARRVRHAIAQGNLRELVEARVRSAPELVATLRRLDRDHAAFFEQRAPALRTRKLPIVSRESLTRPEIGRWLARLDDRYTLPATARTLVVLPCSATKPYERSASHRRMRPIVNRSANGRAHVVTLTSPLGAVPEELELAYPAAHYDIPVTGDWSAEEATLVHRAFSSLAASDQVENVILHLVEDEAALIEDVFPKAERTVHAGESPTADEPLQRLRDALRETNPGHPPVARRDLFREHMRARLDWQFGRGVGDAFLDGATIRGRYPRLKILDGDRQLALLQPERGAVTLTVAGGQRLLAATDAFTIAIDDFTPKGTLFAAGVTDTSFAIRAEDEVLIVHDGELRGVGRALCSGDEMVALEKGAVAEVRHHA